MLVSVIVPIYNRERELEKCIMSILNQTYRELEIILVDDGSTDSSLEICQKYAAMDKRVKVIHKENGGLISARKAGLLAAGGKYIAHIDGDDWVEEAYIEELVKATDFGTIDVAIAGFVSEETGSVRKVPNACPCGLYLQKEIKELIYPILMENVRGGGNQIYPSQCSKLFRRELALEKQMPIDDKCSADEDTLCVYPIILCARSIRIIDSCQYHYVRRMDSVSTYATGAAAYFDTVKYMYEYLKQEFLQYKEKTLLMLQLEKLVSARITVGMKRYYALLINQYIFPYGLVEQGSKVVLYGAGAVGKCFYRQLRKDKYCETVLWVDKNDKTDEIGYAEIKRPERMLEESFDYVVICLQNRETAQSVMCDLKVMGIAQEKIIWREDYKADMDIRFDSM